MEPTETTDLVITIEADQDSVASVKFTSHVDVKFKNKYLNQSELLQSLGLFFRYISDTHR